MGANQSSSDGIIRNGDWEHRICWTETTNTPARSASASKAAAAIRRSNSFGSSTHSSLEQDSGRNGSSSNGSSGRYHQQARGRGAEQQQLQPLPPPQEDHFARFSCPAIPQQLDTPPPPILKLQDDAEEEEDQLPFSRSRRARSSKERLRASLRQAGSAIKKPAIKCVTSSASNSPWKTLRHQDSVDSTYAAAVTSSEMVLTTPSNDMEMSVLESASVKTTSTNASGSLTPIQI